MAHPREPPGLSPSKREYENRIGGLYRASTSPSGVSPSSLPISSVAPPVVPFKESGVSVFCMSGVTAAKNSAKNDRVSGVTGVKSEYVSSGERGMVAAVLSPGDAFTLGKKNRKIVDIIHFHVFLAHVYSSVLKATAQGHGIQQVGELARCKGSPYTNSTPHHGPGSGSRGYGSH